MKYSISVGDLLKRINHTVVAVAVGIVFLATVKSSFATGLMSLLETAHVQAQVHVPTTSPDCRTARRSWTALSARCKGLCAVVVAWACYFSTWTVSRA
jgi:hypothetical protein